MASTSSHLASIYVVINSIQEELKSTISINEDLKKKREETSSLEKEVLDRIKNKHQSLSIQLNEKSIKEKTLLEEIEHLKEENTNLNSRLTQQKISLEKFDFLPKELDRLKEENTNLQSLLASQKIQNASLMSLLTKETNQKESCNRDIKKLQIEITRESQKLKDALYNQKMILFNKSEIEQKYKEQLECNKDHENIIVAVVKRNEEREQRLLEENRVLKEQNDILCRTIGSTPIIKESRSKEESLLQRDLEEANKQISTLKEDLEKKNEHMKSLSARILIAEGYNRSFLQDLSQFTKKFETVNVEYARQMPPCNLMEVSPKKRKISESALTEAIDLCEKSQ